MKKVLMIAGDFTEDYEVMVPYQALQMLGIQVDVVCPDKRKGDKIKTAIHDFEGDQTYTEKPGHFFTLTEDFDYLKLDSYAGLFLTGGRAPEYLRLNQKVLDITIFFMELNLPVAAICHGVQILTAALNLTGKQLTCYDAVAPEVTLAGGTYVKCEPWEAVTSGNLVTSPAWPGNTELLKAFLPLLGLQITMV